MLSSYISVEQKKRRYGINLTNEHLIKYLTLLCNISTGTDPVTDPTTLGSFAKVVESGEKAQENGGSVMKSPTGRQSYRQVVMALPTSRRVGNIFCTASRRTSTTSRKPLTDKPDHKQTSHKDKQTGLEHVPDPSRQD